MNWSQEDFNQALAAIYKKAVQDESFRELVLENPGQAFQEVSGKEFPKNLIVKFIENSSGVDMTFVLPALEGELNEVELDKVAGGVFCNPTLLSLTNPTLRTTTYLT